MHQTVHQEEEREAQLQGHALMQYVVFGHLKAVKESDHVTNQVVQDLIIHELSLQFLLQLIFNF